MYIKFSDQSAILNFKVCKEFPSFCTRYQNRCHVDVEPHNKMQTLHVLLQEEFPGNKCPKRGSISRVGETVKKRLGGRFRVQLFKH